MAFIISKKSTKYGKVQKLYYLVKNYREGNKIKRKTLLRLNSHASLKELLDSVEQKEVKLINRLNKRINTLDDFAKYGKVPFPWGSTKTLLIKKLLCDLEKSRTDLFICQNEKVKIKSFL